MKVDFWNLNSDSMPEGTMWPLDVRIARRNMTECDHSYFHTAVVILCHRSLRLQVTYPASPCATSSAISDRTEIVTEGSEQSIGCSRCSSQHPCLRQAPTLTRSSGLPPVTAPCVDPSSLIAQNQTHQPDPSIPLPPSLSHCPLHQ